MAIDYIRSSVTWWQ